MPGSRSYNDRFCVHFLVFFVDGDGYFRELVWPHMAVIEEQRLFRGEKVEHVFSGLVVSYAMTAELKMSQVCGQVVVVSDGVFEDELEAEFSFLFYTVELQKVKEVFFSVCQSHFCQMLVAYKGSFNAFTHP